MQQCVHAGRSTHTHACWRPAPKAHRALWRPKRRPAAIHEDTDDEIIFGPYSNVSLPCTRLIPGSFHSVVKIRHVYRKTRWQMIPCGDRQMLQICVRRQCVCVLWSTWELSCRPRYLTTNSFSFSHSCLLHTFGPLRFWTSQLWSCMSQFPWRCMSQKQEEEEAESSHLAINAHSAGWFQ